MTAVLGPFRGGEHRFLVRAGTESAGHLERALAPLRWSGHPTSEYTITRCGGGALTVTWDGQTLVDGCSVSTAVATVLWHVNQQVVARDRGGHLLLHAAGAMTEGRLALLVGDSGAGKSTTAAALLKRGFHYLTDEVAILDRDTLEVCPYPKSLSLDTGALDLLGLPAVQALSGVEEHVPWWEIGAPGVVEGFCPAIVMLLRRADGCPPVWEDVPPGEAVLELARATFSFHEDPAANLAALGGLAERVRAVRLHVRDLDDAADLVEELLDGSTGKEPAAVERPKMTRFGSSCVVRVGDDVVIYAGHDGSLHHLDPAAFMAWEMLGAEPDPVRASARLADAVGADEPAVRPAVWRLMEQMKAKAILPSQLIGS